ncbi:MAG: hypothetical protein F6J90_26965 [Moorea sp. SIOASIH]|uniref:hypothetical protein n=1 Tax=Moorena sp. SIOASIH TaxID=2607817 RepID=UPI0013BCEA4F|nr:hypothetical protein [Moorena sp. SIOASIH]NEO39774.1 hypothetical protein [Moorena sp. SIOASIH]
MGLNLIRGKGKQRRSDAVASRGFPPLAIAVVFPTRYCIKTMMIFNDKPHTRHLTPHLTPHLRSKLKTYPYEDSCSPCYTHQEVSYSTGFDSILFL